MAENQTRQTGASVASFIDAIEDAKRRADAKALVKLMQAASGEKAKMWGPAIVGFGSYHYRYDSGREGDMPLVAFSPRKAASVLYNAMAGEGAAALLATLGKHSTSGGCLHIKRLEDVDIGVLQRLLAEAVATTRAKHAS
jgi:hypothetical protein